MYTHIQCGQHCHSIDRTHEDMHTHTHVNITVAEYTLTIVWLGKLELLIQIRTNWTKVQTKYMIVNQTFPQILIQLYLIWSNSFDLPSQTIQCVPPRIEWVAHENVSGAFNRMNKWPEVYTNKFNENCVHRIEISMNLLDKSEWKHGSNGNITWNASAK